MNSMNYRRAAASRQQPQLQNQHNGQNGFSSVGSGSSTNSRRIKPSCALPLLPFLAIWGLYALVITPRLVELQTAHELEIPRDRFLSLSQARRIQFRSQQQNQRKSSKFAYAFFLGGIPDLSELNERLWNKLSQTANSSAQELLTPYERELQQKMAYRGLLYNILASVQILRDGGSKADMILLVYMNSPYASLHAKDAQLLEAVNITIHYAPPTGPNSFNSFATLSLEKFRILDFAQYRRILFMDADITPHCNLDYMFTASTKKESNGEPLLQENVFVSINEFPVSPSFFLVKPKVGEFNRFLKILQEYPEVWAYSKVDGWGHAFNRSLGDAWDSIASLRKGLNSSAWSFRGSDSDAGILFYYAFFVLKNISVIQGQTIQNRYYSPGALNDIKNISLPLNVLRNYSCLPADKEVKAGGYFNEVSSPFNTAPYRDFTQWEYNMNSRPWHSPKVPVSMDYTKFNINERWFRAIAHLDEQFPSSELGLQNGGVGSPSKVSNWNYIPEKKPLEFIPIWSSKVHAYRFWGIMQGHYSRTRVDWITPQLSASIDGSKDYIANTEVSHCHCAAPPTKDICSIPTQDLEDWFEPRLGISFSKFKPACPHAVRHQMHVVLPFYNLSVSTLETVMCSIYCQDYPMDKIKLHFYEDGISETQNNNTSLLPQFCKSEQIVQFQPPPAPSSAQNDFDKVAREAVQQALKERNPESKSGLCIRSTEHQGPAASKYWSFRFVEKVTNPNDVVLLMDGDGELITRNAIQVVNDNYVKKNSWVTYSTYDGNYPEETGPIPNKMFNGQLDFNPRQNQPPWIFGKPWSFKAHLLNHLNHSDFASLDASWLGKAADRCFFTRVLELAGPDRVGFLGKRMYKSDSQQRSISSSKDIDEDTNKDLQHIRSLPQSKRVKLPITVIMACWDRAYLLEHQLGWLQQQSLTKDEQVRVHLLSNDPAKHGEILESVETFKYNSKTDNTFDGLLPIDVNVIQTNWHGYSRLLYVKELRKAEPLDLVIFVNDNQYWPPDFLSSLLQAHLPMGTTGCHGKSFTEKDDSGMAIDLDEKTTWMEIMSSPGIEKTSFTHGRLSGSTLDTNIFEFDYEFLRTSTDLQEIDDLWLSFIMDCLLGWEQRRLLFPVPIDIADLASADHDLNGKILLPLLPRKQVEKLLELHALMVEKQKIEASDIDTRRRLKESMLNMLQSRYHWNALRPSDSFNVHRFEHNQMVPKNESPLPSKQAKNIRQEKRAFVCITGQFARLELENKINTLLKPMQDYGYKVDLALAVSGGESKFTNANFAPVSDLRPDAFVQFFEEPQQALDFVLQQNINLVSPRDPLNMTYDKPDDVPIHQHYLQLLYNMQKHMRTLEEQRKRVMNHPHIFESYQRCMQYAEKAVSEANSLLDDDPTIEPFTIETYYDVFMRMRDDIGFEEAYNETLLAKILPPRPNSVTVTECRGWQGMNDRFAIVSPDVARTYFKRPYDLFALNKDFNDEYIINPETYLLYAFLSVGIQVFAHRELKNPTRMFKNSEGQAAFYADDTLRPKCSGAAFYRHLEHLYELYGWHY